MPKLEHKKIITICSSAAFFKQAVDMEPVLTAMGFTVLLPVTAIQMKRLRNYNVKTFKTWFANPKTYGEKARLMRAHFREVMRGNAILVLNYEKHGVPGYIGGNVLMEMAIAFHNRKKIYLLNPISDKLAFKEEILGMKPVFLNGNLSRLK